MKRLGLYILLASASTACIENDIPYPVVECAVESIEAEGLSGEPAIDATARKVTLPLEETTDIQAVKITACTITERAEASKEIVGEHDLRSPLDVTLSIYQDYPWTIEAQQTIPRIFTVAEQIGSTVWDAATRTAKAYVGFEDLSHVEITGLKLGPQGITRMSCTDVEDFNETNLYLLTDFTTSRRVDVTYHGRTEKWYLTVEYTDIKVSFTQVAPWTHSAWLYADGLSGTTLGFRYRAEGTEEWIEVPQEEIAFDGGSFSTQIKGLLPQTRYEAVAYSNDDLSTVETFTTESPLPLPNGGFEEWSKPGKVVYPYLSEEQAFWDSGNKGSATVSETICESSADIRPGSAGTVSAMLTSKFASLMGIGKFAAGNIFVGTYFETDGTDGILNFGRPFATHPIALRGWMKYTQGQIDIDLKKPTMPPGLTLTNDDMDEGSIYIALGIWTPQEDEGTAESPVQIRTKKSNQKLFDKNNPRVSGYGELILDKSADEWTQFTIPIDWRDKATVPTHLIIVCSASRWGDYFIGSTQSCLWLDDFELIYDDAEL
ncbi:MAG: PCMD domain-containing protein [Alistipes sp.]|nr:PCMD domain-containing protein [Alistipes senegalensis]MCM1250939.1 PCMD domain-containing protein [Alistipes sp.]